MAARGVLAAVVSLGLLAACGYREDGPLYPGQKFRTSVRPNRLAVADFDGDGRLDIAAASGDVQVLVGNGDGTFGGPVTTITGLGTPRGLARGDLDLDGVVDVIASSQFVQVLRGEGDGHFLAIETFLTGRSLEVAQLADLDLDGVLDLVTASFLSDDLNVLIGNGDGSFRASLSLAVRSSPSAVSIADLNGDGVPDIGRHQPIL